jgi:hypothetical protein
VGKHLPAGGCSCAGGEEGRERQRGSCPARWRTRGGGGETAARRRLLLARMGNRGGLSGAGERVREGEQVGLPASAPLYSLISPALLSPRAPNLPRARCFPARLLFPRPFSRARIFLPQPSPYGAHLARSTMNRTPN